MSHGPQVWFVYGLDGDPELPVIEAVVREMPEASYVKQTVGVGKPFYYFQNTLPFSPLNGIGWDPSQAPIVSNSVSDNQAAIDAMIANPPGPDKVWGL